MSERLLSDLHEFDIIRSFFPPEETDFAEAGEVYFDDTAVLEYDGIHKLLVTTDQLIEHVHFRRNWTGPEDLGYKCAAVNYSDIAAMGGRPFGLFLSVGLPSDLPVKWLESFSEGLKTACREEQVSLLGGDTTRSDGSIVICITLLGKAASKVVKTRQRTQTGDALCVTGNLGNSLGGLLLLRDGISLDEASASELLQAHRRPRGQLPEGEWLARHPEVHAMIDLSDGLMSDLSHLERGFEVELDRLPVSRSLNRLAAAIGKDARRLAAAGGEDYVLLCTIQPSAYESIASAWDKLFGHPLHRIGTATGRNEEIKFLEEGSEVEVEKPEFSHFKP